MPLRIAALVILRACLLQAAFFGVLTVQANWYVDSVNGSDSNNGTSATTAFQTITKLLTKTVTSGQSICLMTGSTWHDQKLAFLNVDNVTVIGCGSGTRPMIDGSDSISAGAWSKTGGLTSVYQASVTIYPDSSSGSFNVFKNGAFLTYESSTALVDANVNSFTVSTISTSPAIVYVNTGTNPGVDGNTYEYTAIPIALRMNNGWRVLGVNGRRTSSPSGVMYGLQRNQLTNVTLTQGTRHNIVIGDGTVFNNVTLTDGYDGYEAQGPILLTLNDDPPQGLGSQINNTTIGMTTFDGTATGMISHNQGAGSFGAVSFINLVMSNMNGGVSVQAADATYIVGATFTGMSNPCCGYSPVTEVYNVTATNTTGFDIQAGTAGEAVTVTVNNWTSVNGATHFNISQPNVTLNITNCDFSTGHSTFGILNTQSPFTLNVNGTQWNSNYPYQLSGASNAYTGDHNNFANLSFFNVTGIGSASTVPAWCVLSGQDCHSTP